MATPEQDADALRKAMKGIGTDEAAIIKIIANRTNAHRQKIKVAYKSAFGRDLISDLKSELHGNFEDAVLALFVEPVEYDCDQLKKAMKGAGTDEVSLLQCARSENNNPNPADCQAKATQLYEAGEAKRGTDSDVFIKIFSLSSPAELVGIAKAYHAQYGKTILEAIKNEFSGHIKELLTAIVYAMLSPSEYFATRVNKAIKGWGTNDNLLIRVLVTRDEIDMPQIKQYYKQLYNKDMIDAIKGDCKGDYQKLLVELCSH